MKLAGRWRIVEMELWDEDAIDLDGPAFIELRDDDQGSFRFIAVEGRMDVREVVAHVEVDPSPRSDRTARWRPSLVHSPGPTHRFGPS